MTEEEARSWIQARFGVSRETLLDRFAAMLVEESDRQNLIAASTLPSFWVRHLADSAQLLDHAPGAGLWIDVGSGAGLPGIVVACLRELPIVLVEPRTRRVEFLQKVIDDLRLTNASVFAGKIESYRPPELASVVSARAVAALPNLFSSTVHCTDSSTIWVLPKGRNAQSEVDAARGKWQGLFHVEQSITDPESGIVIAQGVRPR